MLPTDDNALSTVVVPPPVVDLIANGVWRPVAALLAERFPGGCSGGSGSIISNNINYIAMLMIQITHSLIVIALLLTT